MPPAAPTPRKPLPSVSDAEEVHLASSSILQAAEELKPPPPVPTSRKSAVELAPIAPRPPSSADLVTSASPLPAASVTPARPAQPSSPSFRDAVTPTAPMVVPAATQSSPAATMSEAAQEQLAAVLRAVLESTLAPVLAKQHELETRIEALQARPSTVGMTPTINVRAHTATGTHRSVAPSVDITGSFNSGAPSSQRPSLISTSYGLVSVPSGPAPRPAIEEALEKVGPVDVPDFGGSRRLVGGIVIGILILGVIGAILATILSYS